MNKGDAVKCPKCGKLPYHRIIKKVDPPLKYHEVYCRYGDFYTIGNTYSLTLDKWNVFADS